MNKKQFFTYMLSAGIMVSLVLAAVFLPQKYSELQDKKYLNQITLQKREKVDVAYQKDLSFEDKVRILTLPKNRGKNFVPKLLSQESAVSQEKLVQELKKQIGQMWGISTEGEFTSMNFLDEMFAYAELYSISDEEEQESVLFWYVRFTDYKMVDMAYCMDAYTYKIYGAEFKGYRNEAEKTGDYFFGMSDLLYYSTNVQDTSFLELREKDFQILLLEYYEGDVVDKPDYFPPTGIYSVKIEDLEFRVVRDFAFKEAIDQEEVEVVYFLGISSIVHWMEQIF